MMFCSSLRRSATLSCTGALSSLARRWFAASRSLSDALRISMPSRSARLDEQARGATEHHQVEQRIAAQTVGAVNGYAGRLAAGIQARDDLVVAVGVLVIAWP
jgi:hypothetical protein